MDPSTSVRNDGTRRLTELVARVATMRLELLLFFPFGLLWLLGLAFGLPANVPDASGLAFVERHYFRPIVVAFGLQVLVLRYVRRGRSGTTRRDLVALFLLTVCTVFVHMNFKAWTPLVHPRLFDAELAGTDHALGSLVHDLITLRQTISRVLWVSFGIDVDPLYHSVFIAMFFVSTAAHAVFDTANGFRRLVVGMCAVLLIGGVAYWIFPARGPFVFRSSPNQAATAAQAFMLHAFDEVIRTRRVPVGAFVAPLAAMPSLHTAHSLLFLWFAAERVRILLWLYVPAVLWILLEAVASGWHYVIDLPAGALLTVVVVWGVRRALPEPQALGES